MDDTEFELMEQTIRQHMESATEMIINALFGISEAGEHK